LLFQHLFMIHFDSSTIVLAVIGLVGVMGSAVVLTYSFTRNRTGNGRFQ
jgi:hypothetical protein